MRKHRETCTGMDIHRRDCSFCKASFSRPSNCRRHEATCRQNGTVTVLAEAPVVVDEAAVVLNEFGQETMDHIDVNFIDDCIRRAPSGPDGVILLVEKMREAPANDNLKLVNLHHKIFRVFAGGKWKSVDKDSVMRTLIVGCAERMRLRYFQPGCPLPAMDATDKNRMHAEIENLRLRTSRNYRAIANGLFAMHFDNRT